MVVRTDLCHYTEYKIYPGRGQKFVAKDGKVSFFLTAKADALFHQKIKAAKLQWTQAWRRMNKKGKIEVGTRKNKKKAAKFQKAIVGMSVADIARMKQKKDEFRKVYADEKAKEKAAKKSSSSKPKANLGPSKANLGKQMKNMGGPAKKTGNRGKM